ncbi:OmpA family protein [Pseudanabaena sp. UWO310]|uniref:OmpA family protein n=1 Tax=Pseudanabaena sp. UWO310 TaxID=2480795 RepID=UPI00115B5C84|nr:BON domain-containing protein [Pseudanabaena sp. UWO310]TYQ26911.1 BON domain-containing protein [Pseudanabaena sp. UWO310]
MSERKSNPSNNALSEVEKFLLLLSDLNIIESDHAKNIPAQPQRANLPPLDQGLDKGLDKGLYTAELPTSSNNERTSKVSINKSNNAANRSIKSHESASIKVQDEEISELRRSPVTYSFPSLLDELPFLREPPLTNGSVHSEEERQMEEQALAADILELESVNHEPVEFSNPVRKEEEETVHLIQSLLLGLDQPSHSSSQLSQEIEREIDRKSPQTGLTNNQSPINQSPNISNTSNTSNIYFGSPSDDAAALHLLQDILVVPEIEDLRSFKISVEQKLGIVESQVNSPELMNKIKDLENLVQHASLDLSNFGSKLLEIGNEQDNIPTEIANVRERVAQLENRIYEPQELVQLLLPIIAELLSLKTSESREEMCQAITPIIAEVIFERSQLDRLSMSHAIADLLPNAISEQIRNSPEQIAKALGPEVGAAIREQIRIDRDEIVDSLAPEMGSAIKRQIDLERDAMVDALYPVIGNTIAKYFAEAIRSINEKVEQTFSLEGLQRKMRAKIRGVSEAELILKESVPFEVQAIFLIHNLSGLVIIDIQQSDLYSHANPIDADMLAGMLTAIRSFASECISRSERTTELDAINYSGSKILLEVAGYCYLAVIIEGEPDLKLVTKIRDVFGQVVQVHGESFKEFDGDTSLIDPEIAIALKTLMAVEEPKDPNKPLKGLILMGLAIAALIFIPIGMYQSQSIRDRQIEAKILEALAATPELAVYRLNVNVNGDRLSLSGKLPNQYLRNRAIQVATTSTTTEKAITKIDNNIYTVNIPPDPELVANEVQRLTKVLNYTQGINIQSEFKDGQVTITGQIDRPRLIPKITQTFTKIAGVTTVSNAATLLMPKLTTKIYFPFKITTLQPTDSEKLLEVQAFLDLYPDYDLQIFAKSDSIGDRLINYELGMKRARTVREALLQRGVNAKRLHISGIMDISVKQSSDQILRWVEFQPMLKPMSTSN